MKKLYSFKEAYFIVYNALRSISVFKKSRDNNFIDLQFVERIMLAVTSVNGCAMCSYAHTQMALEAGLSKEEIESYFDKTQNVSDEEMVGILYAQHYADTRCKPTEKSTLNLISHYKEDKAKAIIASIRIITFGNVYGIPLGSFIARFNKQSKTPIDPRSNVFYEIFIVLLLPIYLVIGFIHVLISKLLNKSFY